MIGFKIGGEFLDMDPSSSLQIEVYNPLFNGEEEKGMFTYDTNVPLSPKNLRLLGFPGSISVRSFGKGAIPAELWLGNRPQLFRSGSIRVSERAKGLRVSFQGDAQNVPIGNDRLRDLDLGTEELTLTVKSLYPLDTYALFPIKNKAFYGEKNSGWGYYLNFFKDGIFHENTPETPGRYALTPFPYLVHVLTKVFAHYGYALMGDWAASAAARSLVIYNTYALDNPITPWNFEPEIDFKNHVPDLSVGEFLKKVRGRLGLAFLFNTTSKEVEIVRKQDRMEDAAYFDWTELASPESTWNPNDSYGFVLGQREDGEDTLVDELGLEWDRVQVGNGETVLTEDCGTLPMIRELVVFGSSNQEWLVPEASQEGNSLSHELGTGKEFSLRLLSYHGLQPDSEGNLYPFGSSETVNAQGDEVAEHSLILTGESNLYDAMHKDWVEFLSETETFTRTVKLGAGHLLQMDPKKKVMIREKAGYLKAFWQKINFTVHATKGIQPAKVTLFKTMR